MSEGSSNEEVEDFLDGLMQQPFSPLEFLP